jgi:protein-S-isoprenylcysteine O-methyltransferase Ste14
MVLKVGRNEDPDLNMSAVYEWLFPCLWTAWAAYWWVSSRHAKVTVRRESLQSRLLHMVPLALAALLIALPALPIAPLDRHLFPSSGWLFWTGAAITACGLALAVWARRHIGTNWSGTVTIKLGHELVTSGPYAIVRHPIYTGLLLAFLGSALPRGEVRGVLAVLFVGASLWRKLRNEEAWMEEQFGDDYRKYRTKVSALVPFIL